MANKKVLIELLILTDMATITDCIEMAGVYTPVITYRGEGQYSSYWSCVPIDILDLVKGENTKIQFQAKLTVC